MTFDSQKRLLSYLSSYLLIEKTSYNNIFHGNQTLKPRIAAWSMLMTTFLCCLVVLFHWTVHYTKQYCWFYYLLGVAEILEADFQQVTDTNVKDFQKQQQDSYEKQVSVFYLHLFYKESIYASFKHTSRSSSLMNQFYWPSYFRQYT